MPSHHETYHPSDYQPPDGSWASSDPIRRTMLHNRARDTKPELAIRREVHRRGMRYRVAVRPLKAIRRSADLVFTRAKVAVFVDGCFWHHCPEHFRMPSTNTDYWRAKILSNEQRDRDTDTVLTEAGWTVVRVWEHELAAEAVLSMALRVVAILEPVTRPMPPEIDAGWTAPEGSWATSEATRRTMLHNRGRDTKPELRLRSEVHRRGMRYLVNRRPVLEIRRTADLVFTRARVAVFVDGCFWHGCPQHATMPTRNRDFWEPKLTGTILRDRETDRLLAEQGWTVVRIWEHEIVVEAATRIEDVVRPSGHSAPKLG